MNAYQSLRLGVGALALFLLRCTYVIAGVPKKVPIPGRLNDSSGAPLDGEYLIKFAINDAPTEGAALWDAGSQSRRYTLIGSTADRDPQWPVRIPTGGYRGGDGDSEPAYEVNLRYYELKAKEARIKALEAERVLDRARDRAGR